MNVLSGPVDLRAYGVRSFEIDGVLVLLVAAPQKGSWDTIAIVDGKCWISRSRIAGRTDGTIMQRALVLRQSVIVAAHDARESIAALENGLARIGARKDWKP